MSSTSRRGKSIPLTSAAIAPILKAITTDICTALGIPKTGVQVISVEAEVWPDAGLGCPDPDRSYSQVTVEGMQIVLEAAGQQIIYHTEGLTRFVRCADGRPISNGVVSQRR